MPVGAYTKDEIRQMAERIGLPVARKKDSQEICFIPDKDYAGYIRGTGLGEIKEGNFVNAEGEILGKHKGIIHYTIGQRKGLNLSLGHPVFVQEIRPDTNEVVLGRTKICLLMWSGQKKINFMAVEDITKEVEAFGKIRYNHKGEE